MKQNDEVFGLIVYCRRWLLGLAGFGLLVTVACAQEDRPAPVTRYVEGEVLVRYHSAAHRRAMASGYDDLPDPSQRRPLHAAQRLDGRPIELIQVPGRSTTVLLDIYRRHPAVESVTPNYIRRVQRQSIPDDFYFNQQWALLNTGQTVNGFTGTAGADIAATWAWPMSRPATQDVVIAVIDTGVDYRHPDLASRMWINPGEIPGSGLDDDGNGYVDDVYGYDFSGISIPLNGGGAFTRPPGPDPMDIDGHGTHISGIAAAVADNAIGIAGVSGARIMALKASPDGFDMPLAASIEAMAYAVTMKTDHGVPVAVINASFGGYGGSNSVERDTIIAAGAAGIVICAAAGNDSVDIDADPFYPASYSLPNLVAVAASDQHDARAGFSNYGESSVGLAAPGANILSSVPLWGDTQAALTYGTTNYSAAGMEFAGFTNLFTAPAYNCGYGHPHEFPSAVDGRIALIERGELFFYEKIENAMAAGAAAVVMYNNTAGMINGTLTAPAGWIPVVVISQADGQAILSLPQPLNLTSTHLPVMEAAYGLMEGTSMATPFVAGAIAFMARQLPDDTPAQRIARLLDNVDQLPVFAGIVESGGRLNLRRAIDSDADGLPDWWELDWVGNLDDMDDASDYDSNGFIDLHEYLAGTDPTDPASALTISEPPAPDGAGFMIAWQSVTNRWYDVERGTNLVQGFTVTVATNLPGQPPRNYWTDPTPPAEAEAVFYRIRLAE